LLIAAAGVTAAVALQSEVAFWLRWASADAAPFLWQDGPRYHWRPFPATAAAPMPEAVFTFGLTDLEVTRTEGDALRDPRERESPALLDAMPAMGAWPPVSGWWAVPPDFATVLAAGLRVLLPGLLLLAGGYTALCAPVARPWGVLAVAAAALPDAGAALIVTLAELWLRRPAGYVVGVVLLLVPLAAAVALAHRFQRRGPRWT
jgi:hypothetical protein